MSSRVLSLFVSALLILGCTGPGSCENSEQASVNRPIQDKWAVIIGVSKFASPKIPVLKYPSKDALDFYNFLTTKGNFAKDHVLLLRDEKATKVSILDAFGDGFLPRRVLENDLVVVFISSHGSPADVAGENFIIAHDTDPDRPYATGIRLQDLSSELTKRTGCDRIVLLLDACHSGAAVASGEKGLTRAPANFNLDSITGEGQLVISSSKPDESSWESKRYPNGVFTKHLIGALESNGTKSRLGEVYNTLKDNVQQEVRFDRVASQTPMILNKWKGLDVSLCAPPATPRTVLPELKNEQPTPEPVAAKPPQTPKPPVSQRTEVAFVPPSYDRSTSPASSNNGFPTIMSTHWRANGGDVTLESGTILIRPEDLTGLSYNDLECLYNEAYARHGRGFTTKSIQDYFNRQPWYSIDPDYHYRPNDPRVVTRGSTDDPLVVNERRTPKQWANMMTIKRAMQSKRK